jgi:hypothetical protein
MEARTDPDTRSILRLRPFRDARPPALPAATPQVSAFTSARVVACDGSLYRTDNGLRAQAALSCVIKPETGDLVQLFNAEGRSFITAILCRQAFERADAGERSIEISIAGADTLLLSVPKLCCVATESIALVAGQACDITSPHGRVTLTARNLFTVASDTLVQQARTALTHAVNYSVKALELLHLKGRQQLISAETEVRLDGQYINMG